MTVPRRHQIEPLTDGHRRPGIARELLPIGGFFLTNLRVKFRETASERAGVLTAIEERPHPRIFLRNPDGPALVKLRNQQILRVR